MEDDFRVRGGLELVTCGLQNSAEFEKIVDFAIEHDPYGLIFVGKRLPSSVEVDNAQASMA
jgi:hypothetical protein